MPINSTSQRYISAKRKPNKWRDFDAQPAHVKQFLQNFPLNVWPQTPRDHSHLIPDLETKYLAGLESVWGPDHPAVQDARKQVAIRDRKPVRLLSPADLSDLF